MAAPSPMSTPWARPRAATVPGAPVVAVVVEPDRPRLARELLGEAVHIADAVSGTVVAVGPDLGDAGRLAVMGRGPGRVVRGHGRRRGRGPGPGGVVRRIAPVGCAGAGNIVGTRGGGAGRGSASGPGSPVTPWASGWRAAAWWRGSRPSAEAWSPPSGSNSGVQMATVRPGVLPLRAPRPAGPVVPVETLSADTRGRVEVLDAGRDDEVEALLAARGIVAVGQGVAPEEYGELDTLCKVLGAEMGATRKVTDKGWLPRARQIGITGHSVAPALYVAIGVSGKFNHVVGARGAGTIVAINSDPEARILEWADVGIVADWHEVVPLLVDALG